MCNIRHGINEHDFEARRQMPQLGQFSTQDPLKWDNPDVSPYLYCAANPIRFTDPTGCYIVGTDGKRVTFQNETWSKNASMDVQRIGNSMMLTKTGTKLLNDMVSRKYPIRLSLDDKTTGEIRFAKTDYEIDKDKRGHKRLRNSDIVKGDIVIFLKVIEANKDDDLYKNSGLSTEEMIGTIATHEATHVTDTKAMLKMPKKYL